MFQCCQSPLRRGIRYIASLGLSAEVAGIVRMRGLAINLPGTIYGFNDIHGPDPLFFIVTFIGFIFCLSLHEAAHAFCAYRLGDTGPRSAGRISLSPFAHIDPLALILGMFLSLGVIPIAWTKPVPVNVSRLRGGRFSETIVAFSGPLVNVLLGFVLALILRYSGIPINDRSALGILGQILLYLCQLNLILFAFNLIPIPPLDGWGILRGILPQRWIVKMYWLELYGPLILLAFIFFVPFLIRYDLLGQLGWLIANFVNNFVYGL